MIELYSKKLFAFNKQKQIKVWEIKAYQFQDKVEIHILYGLKNGALTLSKKEIAGKNIGKSNETTPAEQAISEAKSLVTNKESEGYTEDESRLEVKPSYSPMLAVSLEDIKEIIFPIYVQPKLDGFRCVAVKRKGKVYLYSRSGKDISESISHILIELKSILKEGEIYDGELYCHGIDFEEIASLIKKRSANSKNLIYYVFDTINELGFEERFNNIRLTKTESIKLVETKLINDNEELLKYESISLSSGYEGVMLRSPYGLYEKGYRSKSLIKMKRFCDAEFKIVNVKEASGNDSGTAIFVCETKDGQLFSVRPKGTRAYRAQLLLDKELYLNKYLTVRYQSLLKTGIPRFPVGIKIRPEWDYEKGEEDA